MGEVWECGARRNLQAQGWRVGAMEGGRREAREAAGRKDGGREAVVGEVVERTQPFCEWLEPSVGEEVWPGAVVGWEEVLGVAGRGVGPVMIVVGQLVGSRNEGAGLAVVVQVEIPVGEVLREEAAVEALVVDAGREMG